VSVDSALSDSHGMVWTWVAFATACKGSCAVFAFLPLLPTLPTLPTPENTDKSNNH